MEGKKMNEHLEELQHEIEQEANIEDAVDDEVAPSRYDITSYGIDFDVDGLVRRVKRGDIYIPEFQREFVWKMPESSRFIESLLLGLPVPGIFLAQEQETGKLLVIDGQQRLLSLKYFFDGYFNPQIDAVTKRVFKLVKVQKIYENKTYETLGEKDRINLENSVIHATVVKQDSPPDNDTSIYHIFERLNSGGRKLTAQEIRTAVYHGTFIDELKELNEYAAWRKIFGAKNDHMRDHELIVRFFAMLENSENYKKPMNEFLNKYIKNNRNMLPVKKEFLSKIFKQVVDLYVSSIDTKIFRPVRALNVALYESAMVGLAYRVLNKDIPENGKIKEAYTNLLNKKEFTELISQSTSDATNVTDRLKIAKNIFMEV
jgi:hypothetical protein